MADADRKKFLANADQRVRDMMTSLNLTPDEDAFAFETGQRLVQQTMEAYVEKFKTAPKIRNEAMSAACAYALIIIDELVTQRKQARKPKPNN